MHLNAPRKTIYLGAVILSSRTRLLTDAFHLPSRMADTCSTKWLDFNSKDKKCIPRQMETCVYSERRQFITLATTGFISHAFVCLYNPIVTEAKDIITPDNKGGPKTIKGMGGLPKYIRIVGNILDELQRDLMEERWDLVEKYPGQLRSFLPVFTKYTDSAFSTSSPTDKDLRVALRYEVGRFSSSVVLLKKATAQRSLDEAYIAFADMSLHFDRYLHLGGLYASYDASISKQIFFQPLSYANQKRDPPLVKDLIVLIKGPDKGRTGIVIGIYPDGSKTCVVKLNRYNGLREIKVVPLKLVGKRVGEQDPDDVFLAPRRVDP